MGVKGKDHYATLGVARDATAEDIKKAFRKMARTCHPDAGGCEDDFKAINEANEVLSDPKEREAYDLSLRAPQGFRGDPYARAGGGMPRGTVDYGRGSGLGDLFPGFGDENLWDLLNQSGTQGGPGRPGQGVHVEVTLSFDDAFRGTEVEVPSLGGRKVKIPAGVTDGGSIRLPGQGLPGTGGGPAGDLKITTHIRAGSSRFGRDGADVTLRVPLSPREAVLGTELAVPTPDGKRVRLRVPAGTPHGKRFRVRGQGAPKLKGGGRGDLVVAVEVAIPETVTDAERAAWEALPDGKHLRGHLS